MEYGDANRVGVTAVFDTPEAGGKIVAVVNRVNGKLGEELDLDLRLWSTRVLELPKAFQQACSEAEASDLLAVALAGSPQPEKLERLVEEWSARHRDNNLSALLIFQAGGDVSRRTLENLRRIAGRHGLPCICPDDEGTRGR